MSIIGLLCLLFALIAALVLVLYALQRRDMKSVVELSQQLQRIAIGGRLAGRVDVSSDKPEVAALVTAVNHLLTRAAPGTESGAVEAPKLFALSITELIWSRYVQAAPHAEVKVRIARRPLAHDISP